MNEVAVKKKDCKGKQTLISYVRLLYNKLVPRFLSVIDGSVQEEVIGERVNLGGGFGLEIKVRFHFYGHENTNN